MCQTDAFAVTPSIAANHPVIAPERRSNGHYRTEILTCHRCGGSGYGLPLPAQLRVLVSLPVTTVGTCRRIGVSVTLESRGAISAPDEGGGSLRINYARSTAASGRQQPPQSGGSVAVFPAAPFLSTAKQRKDGIWRFWI